MAHHSSSARTFGDTTRNDSPTRISSRSVDICFLISSNAAGTCFSSFSEIHSRLCCRGRLYGPEMLEINAHINAHIAAHSSCELLPSTALLKKCHCNLSLILRIGSPVSKKSPLCKCQRQGWTPKWPASTKTWQRHVRNSGSCKSRKLWRWERDLTHPLKSGNPNTHWIGWIWQKRKISWNWIQGHFSCNVPPSGSRQPFGSDLTNNASIAQLHSGQTWFEVIAIGP